MWANPYPIQERAPQDTLSFYSLEEAFLLAPEPGLEVLRVQVEWLGESEVYQVSKLTREFSGTAALYQSAQKLDPLGSYKGIIFDTQTGSPLAFQSLGTGKEYRKLVRALTFRFPMQLLKSSSIGFALIAEEPHTGVMIKVLEQPLDLSLAVPLSRRPFEVRKFENFFAGPRIKFNIYSEGYVLQDKELFFQMAARAVDVLRQAQIPGVEAFEFSAIFSPSKLKLGRATSLGFPIPERDSFLGLYYPYWNQMGRWYNVIYPTREHRYRDGLGQVPYDFVLVLVDSGEYWGVGNFREITAVPTRDMRYFRYLLLHELGHYFGLNEEYNMGGRTELEFAEGILEPWSQNISFLNTPLKWGEFVDPSMPIPTPSDYWEEGGSRYGAYRGGYAESKPLGRSHIPGLECLMESGRGFCTICKKAIAERVRFELGMVY